MSKSERRYHRKTAARCFNQAWDYLVKKKRTVKDDMRMLNLAHASAYHWSLVGSPRNRAVGAWQISRIYGAIGEPRLALQFAKSCLEICQKDGLSDIVHTANEAMARAHAIVKDYVTAERYLSKARTQLDKLMLDTEDREIYLKQFHETEKLIRR